MAAGDDSRGAGLRQSADQWLAWARGERQHGRLDRAEAGLRRALTLAPTSRPVRFDLASLLLDRGEVDGAASIVEPMAAKGGERPDLLWLQARLAIARSRPDDARATLTRLLGVAGIDEAQRAEALLTLGLVVDDLGDPATALALAAQGKAIQRALHAATAGSREGEVAKLRRIGAWIAGQPSPPPHETAAPARHVFLFGFPRSGTTLLEQILAAHPGIATLEEEATLAVGYEAFLADADACDRLATLGDDEAEAWATHYWHGIRERGIDPADRVFVDKQPAGTLYLPLVARLFPDARILFALRDPRDVVLSCLRQPFAMNAMTYAFTDLAETAACYEACMTLAERARAAYPLAWLDVRHETLVDDLAGETDRVLAFLGLQPHAATLDVAATARARAIRTPSARQVRAGINRRGLGRWRQVERDLAPVLPVLAPWVERFGY